MPQKAIKLSRKVDECKPLLQDHHDRQRVGRARAPGGDTGQGLTLVPIPLNMSSLCPFPLNISLHCPPDSPT